MTLSDLDLCSVNVFFCSPVWASQRRMVLSQLPLASIFPSGLSATVSTTSLCSVKCFLVFTCVRIPEANTVVTSTKKSFSIRTKHQTASKILKPIFRPIERFYVLTCAYIPKTNNSIGGPTCDKIPSGVERHTTDICECPVNIFLALPVRASQKQIVPSLLPLANVLPSGLNAKCRTSHVFSEG